MDNLLKGRISLFITAVLWGGGFIFMHSALNGAQPYNILAIRFIIAAVAILIIKFRSIKKHIFINYKIGIYIGIALFLAFAFQSFGLVHTTPSKNAFLTATNVIFVPIFSLFVFKKKLEAKTIIGSLIMVVGLALSSLNTDMSINKGDLLTLICAIFFAIHIILISKFVNKYNLYSIVFTQLLVAGILSFVFSLFFESFTLIFPMEIWKTLIFLGIVSSGLTFFLQNYGMQYVSANESAIILSTEALFGTIFSVLFISEQLTLPMLIGFMLMFFAIILVETNLFSSKIKKAYRKSLSKT